MEIVQQSEPMIDEEVRAFVLSLCSALGGSSAGDDGRYVLGDDALAVLKDIKRWLRLYDDKLSRLDIARLLAYANLVKGDLLPILANWPEDAAENSFRSKVALLCVDLLTVLTWPIDKDEQKTTIHRYIHIPFLQKAQASYKNALLHHESRGMLRTVVRVALPALAQPRDQRTPMQENIIKVVLFLFRNVAMISQMEDPDTDNVESDISRSATIEAFHKQDIFSLILTLCSSIHEDFSTHDTEILDILFHIVKGIDVERLFLDREEAVAMRTKELQDLLSKEKGMMAGYLRHAPSRHNRFGAMMWVKRDDEKYSTVFGQKATVSQEQTMSEIDRRKKWTRPQRNKKQDTSELSSVAFDTAVPLVASAKRHLLSFVEQFLDSSFNPLFLSVRHAIEREADRVEKVHTRQYLYLISWFLRAECARRKKQAVERSKRPLGSSKQNDIESFSLVAAVMSQETFVLLNRSMQRAQDDKDWQDLNAGMKCCTQILLTVQEMSESPLDEDQEIAENILSRIFYEQSTHDRIIGLLRTYKDQGFGYLDACTELAHVFIRLLERYSKQNVDLQIRSRRRRAQKKKKQAKATTDGLAEDDDGEDETVDIADAERVTSERKFDFNRFAAKFVNQGTVDTFVVLLRHFKELSTEQLKRVHRFLYRAAFKMEQTALLFRMDIIALLHKMIKGPDGLHVEGNSSFKEWEELARQIFRRLTKRLEETPALGVELLFSKIGSTLFYLDNGYDREPPKPKPRKPAELEVKPGMNTKDQIGVVVTLLIEQSKFDILTWIKGVLESASDQRKAWEDAHKELQTLNTPKEQQHNDDNSEIASNSIEQGLADPDTAQPSTKPNLSSQDDHKAPLIYVKADDDAKREATSRDKYVRLLLSVLSFQSLDFMDDVESENKYSTWIIPSSLSSSTLSEYREHIQNAEFHPPEYEEGLKSAEDFVRRKTAPRPEREQQDSDSEGDSDIAEGLFPAGGPNIERRSVSPTGTKRRRGRHASDEMLDEKVLEERREARRRLEAERARKIKSELFVHESDDETDEERDRAFFQKEEKNRMIVQKQLMNAMTSTTQQPEKPGGKETGKRKRHAVESDSEDSNSTEDDALLPAKRRRKISNSGVSQPDSGAGDSLVSLGRANEAALESSDDNDTSAETDTDTPPSSQRPSSGHGEPGVTLHKASNPESADADTDNSVQSDSDKENAGAVPRPSVQKRNVRAGFIIESDSDE